MSTAHVLTTPAATRETLYVAMTRGRHANHLYLTTDTPHPDCHQHPGSGHIGEQPGGQTPDQTPDQILTAILARSGAATSATHAITDAHDAAIALTRLTAIRDTLLAHPARQGPSTGRETPTDVTGPSVEPTSLSKAGVTVDTALTAVRGLIHDRVTRRTTPPRATTPRILPAPATATRDDAPHPVATQPSSSATLYPHSGAANITR